MEGFRAGTNYLSTFEQVASFHWLCQLGVGMAEPVISCLPSIRETVGEEGAIEWDVNFNYCDNAVAVPHGVLLGLLNKLIQLIPSEKGRISDTMFFNAFKNPIAQHFGIKSHSVTLDSIAFGIFSTGLLHYVRCLDHELKWLNWFLFLDDCKVLPFANRLGIAPIVETTQQFGLSVSSEGDSNGSRMWKVRAKWDNETYSIPEDHLQHYLRLVQRVRIQEQEKLGQGR